MKRKCPSLTINPQSTYNPPPEVRMLEKHSQLDENKQRNLLGEEFKINKNSLHVLKQNRALKCPNSVFNTTPIKHKILHSKIFCFMR